MRSFRFGVGGDCEALVGEGWSNAEDGFRWMTGARSELHFDATCNAADHRLELTVNPFLRPPTVPAQKLIVSVNGTPVGEVGVDRPGPLEFAVPAAAVGGRSTVAIVLEHPDGGRPSDYGGSEDSRVLSLAVSRLAWLQVPATLASDRIEGTGGVSLAQVQARTGMTPEQFMLGFESIGQNCEFGVLQRKLGAEPLSLFRFSNLQLPRLLHGLAVQFADLGQPHNVQMTLDNASNPEFMMHETLYGITYHTFRHRAEHDGAKLLAQEPARLALLVRKLVEDLREGRKVFVFTSIATLEDAEVEPLFAALGRYGRNTLLWVSRADRHHPAGTLERLADGFLKGYIGRFAPLENAHDLLLEDWLEICLNAWNLGR